MSDHYHLHCIVTGGGVARDDRRWVATAGHYLFPVRALSRMFRGKYLAGLNALFTAGRLGFHGQLEAVATPGKFAVLCRQAAPTRMGRLCQAPFAGPEQVMAYLSRYTHRVALSPRRLLAADATVTFAYKDYAADSRPKTMTLPTAEFVRRFCLHVLPERFVKIRHYGLLGQPPETNPIGPGAGPSRRPRPRRQCRNCCVCHCPRSRPSVVRSVSNPD